MTALDALPTPCAVVDLDVVERNCSRMADMATARGVRLRPHVKTHKCVEAARLSTRGHFGGITVSTLAEAEAFAEAGFDDITYAVPIALDHVERALALSRRIRLGLLVDHRETIAAVADAASAAETKLRVLLKVDCGYHRAGVEPHRPEAAQLVEQIASAPSLELEGLLTHAGHSYGCVGREAIARVAAQERDVIVRFAEHMRAGGIEVPTVSIGSTPTMSVSPGRRRDRDPPRQLRLLRRVPGGHRELCAGGRGPVGDRHRDRLLPPRRTAGDRDAGALALSKDAGATHTDAPPTYGVLCSLDGAPLEGLALVSLSQEHGVVRGPAEAVGARRIGERLRIVANHSCLTAACHERLHVARGDAVVDVWRPVRGW